MPLKVRHRTDQFLQNKAKQPPAARERRTTTDNRRCYQALLAFVNQRLVGRSFPSEHDISIALGDWPKFAWSMYHVEPGTSFAPLTIYDQAIVCPGLVVALIQNVDQPNKPVVIDARARFLSSSSRPKRPRRATGSSRPLFT